MHDYLFYTFRFVFGGKKCLREPVLAALNKLEKVRVHARTVCTLHILKKLGVEGRGGGV